MLDTISIRVEAVSKTTSRAFSISPQSHRTLLALPHPLHPAPPSSRHTVLLAERELVLPSIPAFLSSGFDCHFYQEETEAQGMFVSGRGRSQGSRHVTLLSPWPYCGRSLG